MMILGKTLEDWTASHPLIRELVELKETSWFNPATAPTAQALGDVGLTAADVADASARLFVSRGLSENPGAPGGAFDDRVSWISPNLIAHRLIGAGRLP